MDRPINDAERLVQAGDMSRPRALKFDKPVLFVPGNQEFYGSSIDAALEELRHLSKAPRFKYWTTAK